MPIKTNFLLIANTCISLGHWPSSFKESSSIIIPKPNKSVYDFPKAFQPIVLLNTMGKLIEKTIAQRIQHHSLKTNFVDPLQLGNLSQ